VNMLNAWLFGLVGAISFIVIWGAYLL